MAGDEVLKRKLKDPRHGVLQPGSGYLLVLAPHRSYDHAAFEAEKRSHAFSPRAGRVLSSYHEVPAEILEDDVELLTWARRALRVARAAPQKSRARAGVSPEQILEGHSSDIQALAYRLRELVREAAPTATEAGYPGWRLIGYRAPHYFCFIAPHAEHVRLGFEHGHRLNDPHGVLEPMGKQVRFVRLVPRQRVPFTAIRGLMREALMTFPKR